MNNDNSDKLKKFRPCTVQEKSTAAPPQLLLLNKVPQFKLSPSPSSRSPCELHYRWLNGSDVPPKDRIESYFCVSASWFWPCSRQSQWWRILMDLDATPTGMWVSLPVLMGCFEKTWWVCLTPGISSSAESTQPRSLKGAQRVTHVLLRSSGPTTCVRLTTIPLS